MEAAAAEKRHGERAAALVAAQRCNRPGARSVLRIGVFAASGESRRCVILKFAVHRGAAPPKEAFTLVQASGSCYMISMANKERCWLAQGDL